VLGCFAGASVPPVVVLLLDPAVVVTWSFVDPLFGLAARALDALIAWTVPRRRERLDLCE
jgi:hypothetical protein